MTEKRENRVTWDDPSKNAQIELSNSEGFGA